MIGNENKIYKLIMQLKNGTAEEKSLAFECIGILGNETIDINLEDKLIIVENMINDYYKKNNA